VLLTRSGQLTSARTTNGLAKGHIAVHASFRLPGTAWIVCFLAPTHDARDDTDSPKNGRKKRSLAESLELVSARVAPRPPPYLEVSAVITCTLPHVSAAAMARSDSQPVARSSCMVGAALAPVRAAAGLRT
jgi:hypothetical protein